MWKQTIKWSWFEATDCHVHQDMLQLTGNVNNAPPGMCTSSTSTKQLDRLSQAIERSRRHVKRAMMERGVPGAVVAVSKYGRLVWSEGLGYADVENDVLCTPDTVMRIASISKALTSVALLQLWQKGLVDLDAPIQTYVPEFPQKTYEGKPVEITTRQLLSHLGGIRHYQKPGKEMQGCDQI